MKFWDSSALVPLLVEEDNSRECRQLYRADPRVVAWQFTRTEVASAIVKGARGAPVFPEEEVDRALDRLAHFARTWLEVTPLQLDELTWVRDRAQSLMLDYTLYSADALQLAGAMKRFDPPTNRDFVVCDGKLADAADGEGFNVIRLKREPRRRGR